MAYRDAFDCLWCGRRHTTRGPDDLEGWAQLCPACAGRAQENGFLRARVRQALAARDASHRAAAALAGPAAAHDPDEEMRAYYAARAPEYDDWYLRRGRYSHGPVHDQAWQAELGAASDWLSGLPLSGRIVELAAGTGWWSPLLARRGELWLFDANAAPLERARERLVAHGLRAHLHVRDAWAEPDAPADALFAGFWISHVPRARLAAFLELAGRWLQPAGRLAFIDSRPDPFSGAADQARPSGDTAVRRLADGREFRVVKVYYEPEELAAALGAAGFADVQVTATSRFFLLGTAVSRPSDAGPEGNRGTRASD